MTPLKIVQYTTSLLFFSAVLVLLYVVYQHPSCSHQKKVVTKVGGCDRVGYCGVVFADGTAGKARYPVEGAVSEEVCL